MHWGLRTVLILPSYTLSPQTLFSKKKKKPVILQGVYYHPCVINEGQRGCVSCPGSHSWVEAEVGLKARHIFKDKMALTQLNSFYLVIFIPVNSVWNSGR